MRSIARAVVLVSFAGVGASACGASSHPTDVALDVGAPTPTPTPNAAEIDRGLSPGEEGYEIYPGVSVDESWVDCSTEDDCAIVEAGCCDHCNGGGISAVNRAFAERAKTLIAAKLAEAGPCQACSKKKCDAASKHGMVCMTRACHIDDLEDEVRDRMWGRAPAPEGDAVIHSVEGTPSRP